MQVRENRSFHFVGLFNVNHIMCIVQKSSQSAPLLALSKCTKITSHGLMRSLLANSRMRPRQGSWSRVQTRELTELPFQQILPNNLRAFVGRKISLDRNLEGGEL